MLDRTVSVEELSANRANLPPLGMFEESLKPLWGNDFYIVVEQQQVFAARYGSGPVIETRKIKGLVISNDLMRE
jgi:hypothetical protein